MNCKPVNVGTTAFMQAAMNGHEDCVKSLLKAGADVNTTDHEGNTALMNAAMSGDVTRVKALLDSGANLLDVAERTKILQKALHLAAECANAEPMELILAAGADVHTPTAKGNTVLLEAAKRGDHRCLEVAIKAGADLNMTDIHGIAALCVCCSTRKPSLVNVSFG